MELEEVKDDNRNCFTYKHCICSVFYLFWNKKTNNFYDYKGWFEKLIKELGIKDFRFHDLRHNAATYYLMNGASETALMELFGWNSREMIKRYAHLTKGHLKDLVEKTTSTFI